MIKKTSAVQKLASDQCKVVNAQADMTQPEATEQAGCHH